ncbi:hypothetical protein AB2874_25950, partial [Escherichia coli]
NRLHGSKNTLRTSLEISHSVSFGQFINKRAVVYRQARRIDIPVRVTGDKEVITMALKNWQAGVHLQQQEAVAVASV